MSKFLSENKFEIITAVIALGAATAAKKFVDKQYERSTGDEPPKNPEDKNYNLLDVLLYTSATAVLGAVVSVIAREIVTNRWKKVDGELPKELR